MRQGCGFGDLAQHRYADLSDFDLLITDASLDEAVAAKVRAAGLDVIA